jgi:class 3 adenylate cyclase
VTQERMKEIEEKFQRFDRYRGNHILAAFADAYGHTPVRAITDDFRELLTALQEAQAELALSEQEVRIEENLRRVAEMRVVNLMQRAETVQEYTARLDFILKHNPTLGWTRELIDAEREKGRKE